MLVEDTVEDGFFVPVIYLSELDITDTVRRFQIFIILLSDVHLTSLKFIDVKLYLIN